MTVEDIAREAGVARATVYRAFHHLDQVLALADALCRPHLSRFLPAARSVRRPSCSPASSSPTASGLPPGSTRTTRRRSVASSAPTCCPPSVPRPTRPSGRTDQLTTEPLLEQLLRYVMSDEARHVAFGVLSLKEYDAELTDAELAERQEFRGGARPASRFGVGGAAGTLRPMSRPSDPRLLVLHGLRLKGVTGADALADAVGLAAGEVTAQLRALEAEGLVAHRSGALNGWTLTPAGRAEQARLVGDEVDATGARDTVAGAYRRFRALNAGVLDACSRWQVRDVGGRPVRNDHRDRAYDAQVVDDLARLHRRAEPMLDDLARALDRYRPYGPRLRHAVDRVAAGDRDWFARPVMPSYHTVWFELHEDLLTTLGLDRSAEPVP